MTLNPVQKVGIDQIEALLRRERSPGQYQHPGHEPGDSAWRRFLADGENLAAVASQVVAISDAGCVTPRAALESVRDLVETVYARSPRTASSFLDAYLAQRPRLPGPVRDRLDTLARAGRRKVPLCAAELAAGLGRRPNGPEKPVFEYWYDQILQGRTAAREARRVPAQVQVAKDRLLSHLRETESDPAIDEGEVYERYGPVFRSRDIPAMTDVVMYKDRIRLDLDVELIEPFLKSFPKDEVMRRFDRLGEWMDKVNIWMNYDGVILTPSLAEHLSQKADFESLLLDLDRCQEETIAGRFRSDNPLQRELEFKHLVSYRTNLHQEPWPPGLYREFMELEDLGPPADDELRLSEEHLLQARRAAYEAACFLTALRGFRANTTRDIVVVGNERYGKQWVVEPLEEHIREGFTVRYEYVRSGASMRLTVPSAFPRDFVKEISERMPHIVVVDGANLPRSNPYKRGGSRTMDDVMRCSRALRGFANWFAVFNDVRAEGDGSRYEHESSLPVGQFPYLKKWHEFATMRRQLEEWVTPGPTYRVTTWAPDLKDRVLLGDLVLDRHHEDLGGDRPLIALANSNIYRTEADGLPAALKGSRTYYFDGPESRVREEIVYGLGPHGFETRVKGPTTGMFVAAVQRRIKAEVDTLLEGWSRHGRPIGALGELPSSGGDTASLHAADP